MTNNNDINFWENKKLEEFTPEEWDALCDGCGKCCLCKLQDDKTGKVFYTNVACRLLNISTCRCTDYENRKEQVEGCAILTPRNVRAFHWLPETCAYRRLALNKDLYKWHYLVSGSRDQVHNLGLSVKNKAVSEEHIHPEQMEQHVVEWL